MLAQKKKQAPSYSKSIQIIKALKKGNLKYATPCYTEGCNKHEMRTVLKTRHSSMRLLQLCQFSILLVRYICSYARSAFCDKQLLISLRQLAEAREVTAGLFVCISVWLCACVCFCVSYLAVLMIYMICLSKLSAFQCNSLTNNGYRRTDKKTDNRKQQY